MLIDVTGNENYNAIRVSGYRTREYDETVYRVSVVPVMVSGYCVRSMCFDGYKQTLATAKRASKKAEAEAMARAVRHGKFRAATVGDYWHNPSSYLIGGIGQLVKGSD